MFTEIIFQRIADFILEGGYFFIFLAMFLEGIIFPLPSEAVLGFVGFLTAQKEFSFLLALLSSVAGSYLCALCYYLIGYFGFKPFVLKYGKYLLLKKKMLRKQIDFLSVMAKKPFF
jgi:membrane protein DedA with SNARE-associated domain